MEVAHPTPPCSPTQGAVVVSKHYELLGFGGEISGKLDAVVTVLKAPDVDRDRFAKEST